MRDLIISRTRLVRAQINPQSLDASLRELLGEAYFGFSTDAESVRVHVAESTPEDDVMRVESHVVAHDPDTLTDTQRTRRDRHAALEQARADFITPLDPADFADALPVIRTLVRRIAWLEREIRDLRDM